MIDYPCYIAGQAVTSDKKLTVYNPYTGEAAGTVASLGKAETNRAIEAALEGGEAGLVTASGMAAISASLLSLLGSGDHLLAQALEGRRFRGRLEQVLVDSHGGQPQVSALLSEADLLQR